MPSDNTEAELYVYIGLLKMVASFVGNWVYVVLVDVEALIQDELFCNSFSITRLYDHVNIIFSCKATLELVLTVCSFCLSIYHITLV